MPRRPLLTLLVLALLLACTACRRRNPNEIRVGAYLSLSGVDSTFGTDTREGIALAVDELNGAGGIRGKTVRMIYEDDKSTPQEASNKVRQLIDRDGVVAVLGEVASSRSLVGGLIANTKKVPMITPSSTAVEVTKRRNWVFRSCFTDAQQGEVAARFVRESLKKTKAGLFYAAQDTYSSGLAGMFKDAFVKLGGEVVVEKGFQKGETNYTTYLQALKASSAEIYFVPVYYNEIAQIARQAEPLGIPGSMFVGGDGWDSTNLVEVAGATIDGAYFTNHYAPDVPWENSRAFIHAFTTRYGKPPNSLSAQGYDAAMLLFDAMKRSEVITPDAIQKALASTKDFAGATGTITIDANHNANKPIVVVAIRDQQFHYFSQLTAH